MPGPEEKKSLGPAGWIALIVLAGFLAAAAAYAAYGWLALTGVGVSPFGWVVLIAGSAVAVAVGAVLMGLLFYSSRHHYDR